MGELTPEDQGRVRDWLGDPAEQRDPHDPLILVDKLAECRAEVERLRAYAIAIEKAYIKEVGVNEWHRRFGKQASGVVADG